MKLRTFVPGALLLTVLSGCGLSIPNGVQLNLTGQYLGKVTSKDGVRLYDVTVVEQALNVTLTFKAQDQGLSFTVNGVRSMQGATPVNISTAGFTGSGAVCEGGATDRYSVGADFYASRDGQGLGNLWHETCDPVGKGFLPSLQDTGVLVLLKK